MTIRRRYRFTGDVQGVGFRFRAYHAAGALGLTGWVRNEYDGSVSMEVQGGQEAIETLLQRIEDSFYIRVDSAEYEELPPDRQESSFDIRD